MAQTVKSIHYLKLFGIWLGFISDEKQLKLWVSSDMKIFDAIGVRDPNHWGFLVNIKSSAFAIWSMNSNVTFVPIDVNIVVRSFAKHNWERIFSGVLVTHSDV